MATATSSQKRRTSGVAPWAACPWSGGVEGNSQATTTSTIAPSPATARNDIRQPARSPSQVPAGTPRPIVDKLAAAIAEALKSPETAQRLSAEGSTPVGSTPDQFNAHIRNEFAKWRKLVKDAALVLH